MVAGDKTNVSRKTLIIVMCPAHGSPAVLMRVWAELPCV